MEQLVTQLQQELFTLRAQVAAECGLADAVRATNHLATAQVRKNTPSLTDVNGLGRPKEFCGRGGFSTMVEEDGSILRWSYQGVCDDVSGDGNHHDRDRSRVLADGHECGLRIAKLGVLCSRCIQRSWLSRAMR